MTAPQSITSTTRKYYDTPATDTFYHSIWGGSQISIGIYEQPNDSIAVASQRTVQRMADLAGPITSKTRILDLGAGYGGSARWLAQRHGCQVTCLNLSSVQNERNRQACVEAGQGSVVKVVEGSFEVIPVEASVDGGFDVVWSQDAFLHSGERGKIVEEIDRVLKEEGGKVVFTDIMEREGVPRENLKGMYERLPVDRFATVGFYRDEFEKRGFQMHDWEERTSDLATHYHRVLEDFEVGLRSGEGAEKVSEDFKENTRRGLTAGAKAADGRDLVWGLFLFFK